jgi:hypothetical protein
VIHNLSNILAHIDDLVVHTKNQEATVEVLDQCLTRLQQHGLKVNLPKSRFCLPDEEHLGFKVTEEGVKP